MCGWFWASWIRIRILLSSSKKSKKNLDSYCSATSFWLFIFENWRMVNVPSKSTKQKNYPRHWKKGIKLKEWTNCIQCSGSVKSWDGSGSLNPYTGRILLITFSRYLYIHCCGSVSGRILNFWPVPDPIRNRNKRFGSGFGFFLTFLLVDGRIRILEA